MCEEEQGGAAEAVGDATVEGWREGEADCGGVSDDDPMKPQPDTSYTLTIEYGYSTGLLSHKPRFKYQRADYADYRRRTTAASKLRYKARLRAERDARRKAAQ